MSEAPLPAREDIQQKACALVHPDSSHEHEYEKVVPYPSTCEWVAEGMSRQMAEDDITIKRLLLEIGRLSKQVDSARKLLTKIAEPYHE